MYDELVKELRDSAEWADRLAVLMGRAEGDTHAPIMRKAADAIEELSKLHETQKRNLSVLTDELMRRWIPVTERLPEQRINQNTLDFEYVLCATTFGDVRPFKYGRRIGQGDAHFWNGAGYVDAYVTHWMPLPEPPKEEA